MTKEELKTIERKAKYWAFIYKLDHEELYNFFLEKIVQYNRRVNFRLLTMKHMEELKACHFTQYTKTKTKKWPKEDVKGIVSSGPGNEILTEEDLLEPRYVPFVDGRAGSMSSWKDREVDIEKARERLEDYFVRAGEILNEEERRRLGKIIKLGMEGYKFSEMPPLVGCSLPTINRLIEKCRKHFTGG